jgi:dTDP-4-amino-4,6-dideoxygalactose transaminase
MSDRIAFIDLAAQRRRLGGRIDRAIAQVLDHGQFIMGPEVRELEVALARFADARHCISCANGTDALLLVLMAKGVKAGDAVFCPSFTFAATAEVVALAGATPVLVDVLEDSFNLDAASLEVGITTAKRNGLKPVGVIPVDLFGQPADYDAIDAVATAHGLWVLADAAQSFGATYRGRKVGSLAWATTTSFFPAKPLGCYGDGGAIFTDDGELATIIKSLRVHGQGSDKYDNVRIGLNGRLDTVQAAVLLEKLAIFPEEIAARDRVAAIYAEALSELVATPQLIAGASSVWAQYTVRCAERDSLAARLKAAGVPTAIYYPKPLHQQTAYCGYPVAGNGLPISERLAREVLSLPMHPYLDAATQDRIVEILRTAIRSGRHPR